jgi:hypothetical protein
MVLSQPKECVAAVVAHVALVQSALLSQGTRIRKRARYHQGAVEEPLDKLHNGLGGPESKQRLLEQATHS